MYCEGVTVRSEEGARLIDNLGDKRVMFLRNHGILVMGRTLPEAFIKHWSLQRACEIQVATAAMGTPLDVPTEIVAVHQRDRFKVQIPGGAGKDRKSAVSGRSVSVRVDIGGRRIINKKNN